MSFSGNVKGELARRMPRPECCRMAELSALIKLCGTIPADGGRNYCVKVHSENIYAAGKFFDLLKKTFGINADVSVRRNISSKTAVYSAAVNDPCDALTVLRKIFPPAGHKDISESIRAAQPAPVHKTCCRRAFLRGAFLAAGSMSDPNKAYHFEIVCPTYAMARFIQELINSFLMDAKVTERKKAYVVYLKEGSQIVDMLNVMGACISLMELENVRILKEMRNAVNRKVNCETANIQKTVSASVRQTEDILYIRDNFGIDRLPPALRETALLRLANPDATLKELGEMACPAIGKSGVNHRLRKLSEVAGKIREGFQDIS